MIVATFALKIKIDQRGCFIKTNLKVHNLGLGAWSNEQVGKFKFSLTNIKQCHQNNLRI